MIKPTVGRIVWFYPEAHQPQDQPQAAIIAFVYPNSPMINLSTFDQWGNAYGQGPVPLIQDGDEPPEIGMYATWPDIEEEPELVTQRLEDLPEDDED